MELLFGIVRRKRKSPCKYYTCRGLSCNALYVFIRFRAIVFSVVKYLVWRKRWDSNSRTVTRRWFSRPVHSTTLPHFRHRLRKKFYWYLSQLSNFWEKKFDCLVWRKRWDTNSLKYTLRTIGQISSHIIVPQRRISMEFKAYTFWRRFRIVTKTNIHP